MKSIFARFLLVAFFGFFSLTQFVNAHDELPDTVEHIRSFSSNITLHKDDSLTVEETIVYTTGGTQHHGIYRDIPLSTVESPVSKNQSVTVLSVSDEKGNLVQHTTSRLSSNGQKIFRIKIGDPDVTFAGDKTYVIQYIFKHALSLQDTKTYLYWNITGNTWQFPISQVFMTITKDPVDGPLYEMGAMSCTFGTFGSTDSCNSFLTQNGGTVSASFDQVFQPGSGVTLLVPLTYAVSPFPTAQQMFWERYGAFVIFCVAILTTLIICRMIWRKYGRDPDEGRAIMAEYEPPLGVTPFEASYLLHEKIIPKAIGATLLYEAQQGAIQIEGYESDGFFGKFKKLLFKLILIKASVNGASNEFLGAVFKTIPSLSVFGATLTGSQEKNDAQGRSVIELKDVQLVDNDLNKIKKIVEVDLITKGYFDKILGDGNNVSVRVIAFIFFGIFFGFLGFISLLNFFFSNAPVSWQYLTFFIITVCFIVTYKSLSRKTLLGVDLKYKLLGLKRYIDVAEEERIAFHNPPSKTPELYLTLLPWAVLFGLEKKWSKEFEGMTFDQNSQKTSFYTGVGSGVALSDFGSSMEQFSSVAVSSGTPPSSSGGGGSGGGGGGGGGGSW